MKTTRVKELETYLRKTAADQGGECPFAVWVDAVAGDDGEFANEEAAEYVSLGGNVSEIEYS